MSRLHAHSAQNPDCRRLEGVLGSGAGACGAGQRTFLLPFAVGQNDFAVFITTPAAGGTQVCQPNLSFHAISSKTSLILSDVKCCHHLATFLQWLQSRHCWHNQQVIYPLNCIHVSATHHTARLSSRL